MFLMFILCRFAGEIFGHKKRVFLKCNIVGIIQKNFKESFYGSQKSHWGIVLWHYMFPGGKNVETLKNI